MRLDRGNEPTDHHTLFIATGLESKVDHVAFEVVDLDAVEMGQQVLLANRYRHAWGVGRHLLGSQIFDYWRDPWGQKHEHYADGDLFDSAQEPGYHLLDRKGLYQWGPDLPDDFIDAKLTPRRLWTVLKMAVKDRRATEKDAGAQERRFKSGTPLAAIARSKPPSRKSTQRLAPRAGPRFAPPEPGPPGRMPFLSEEFADGDYAKPILTSKPSKPCRSRNARCPRTPMRRFWRARSEHRTRKALSFFPVSRHSIGLSSGHTPNSWQT